MKLSKAQVEEWYKVMQEQDSYMARLHLFPFVLFARVWGEIDVPQVSGKIVDDALEYFVKNQEKEMNFLVGAAADLHKRAKEEPS